jgi:flagellin-like protein
MKMTRLLKSRKALSPVIASIILVAVTVAVSIAVAAWMGALTFSFTKTTQFNVASMTFGPVGGSGSSTNYINMTIQNTGSSAWTLQSTAQVNSATGLTVTTTNSSLTCPNAAHILIQITNVGWRSGGQYSVTLLTTGGVKITYVASAP